jgi:hypothetical protein
MVRRNFRRGCEAKIVTGQRGTSALGFWFFRRDGRVFPQRILDARQYSIDILQHIIIPESNHSESIFLEATCPRRILFDLVGMLATIDLDDESMLETAEIGDVIADEMLTAELGTVQSFAAQMLPEQAFRVGLFAAQATSIGAQLLGSTHNIMSYHRRKKCKKDGKEAEAESRAEVPHRPITIHAAQPSHESRWSTSPE